MNSAFNPTEGFDVGWWNESSIHPAPSIPQSPAPNPPTDRINQAAPESPTEMVSRRCFDDHARSLAAIVEVVSLLNSSESIEVALEHLAKALFQWFAADTVDVYWQHKPCRSAIHRAQEGKQKADTDSIEAARTAAAEEVLSRNGIADTHAILKHDQFSLLALKRYADLVSASRIIAMPLSCDSSNGPSQCRGSVLIQFDRLVSETESDQIKNSLAAASEPMSRALSQIQRASPPRWLGWIASLTHHANERKRRCLAIVLAITLGVMMIPVPYYAPFDLKLQPIGRRFVAAPIDAALEQVLVRPGDHVQKGMLLAKLDDRELEMELIGKQAELARLQQEQKGHLAQHRHGESQLAMLKLQRIQSEIEMLTLRRDRLAIVSPIDGVIIDGDWERSQGAPLTRGETLFEIAPLGKFNAEIELDESDVMRVRKGMALTFRLDAIASQKFSTTVSQIHPRSEIRGHHNVFLADATLQDPDEILRPGMEGSGYVKTDPSAMGWNLFHKAYHRLLVLIGV